jgi:hypothetical protein
MLISLRTNHGSRDTMGRTGSQCPRESCGFLTLEQSPPSSLLLTILIAIVFLKVGAGKVFGSVVLGQNVRPSTRTERRTETERKESRSSKGFPDSPSPSLQPVEGMYKSTGNLSTSTSTYLEPGSLGCILMGNLTEESRAPRTSPIQSSANGNCWKSV